MINLKFFKMEGKYVNVCYFKMIFLFEIFHNNFTIIIQRCLGYSCFPLFIAIESIYLFWNIQKKLGSLWTVE